MKVKILSRNPQDYIRETKRDIHKVPRNYSSLLHPLQSEREYVRGLNAAKLERVFAKPFLCSLDGHKDGVSSLCKHPTSLSHVLSAAYDGEIRQWNLATRACVWSAQAHDGSVSGLVYEPNGKYFLSCGVDKMVKTWNSESQEPIRTIIGKTVFQGITHHRSHPRFATCGDKVDIWDENRAQPISSLVWNVDSVQSIRYNPIEDHLLAGCAADRSVLLYDTRENRPMRKVVLKMRSNRLSWNPLEAMVFTVANEDYNLYSFDLRNLGSALQIHMGHTSAVLDVDYAPTGREFVTGSYDKTIRLFGYNRGTSREIYHTKRMGVVQTILWSSDNKFIVSGSDEMNLRLWKAQASEKLGVLRPRERESLAYSAKLKDKYKQHPQIRRIIRHRHVPSRIFKDTRENRISRLAALRKEENVRRHSKPGTIPHIPAKKKFIVTTLE